MDAPCQHQPLRWVSHHDQTLHPAFDHSCGSIESLGIPHRALSVTLTLSCEDLEGGVRSPEKSILMCQASPHTASCPIYVALPPHYYKVDASVFKTFKGFEPRSKQLWSQVAQMAAEWGKEGRISFKWGYLSFKNTFDGQLEPEPLISFYTLNCEVVSPANSTGLSNHSCGKGPGDLAGYQFNELAGDCC